MNLEFGALALSRESENSMLNLLLRTWSFGFASEAENRSAARFYLAHATERSTHAFAARESGRLIGAAFCRIPGHAPLGFSSASPERAAARFASTVGEARFQRWRGEWFDAGEMLLRALRCGGPEAPSAWLDLLMTAPECRGRGVGRRLVGFVEDLTERVAPEPRIRLLTDTWCGWRFYERMGYRRVLERPARDPGDAFFLYEKIL